MTPLEKRSVSVLCNWYDSLDRYQDGLPSKGTIAAALVVLSRLMEQFDLDVAAHVSGKEAQIAGLSAGSLKKMLAEFGETRVLSSVGGRSNRGARGDVALLLQAMRKLRLEAESPEQRATILTAMRRHIALEFVPRFFAAKRVKAAFRPTHATRAFIVALIANAAENNKAGCVAEHLVGAKLSLKFPKKLIRNKPCSAADAQGGFGGDFEVGATIFHVTLAPMPELFEKCKGNLDAGRRVYLLVPMSLWHGANQMAELKFEGRITVESIESFVSTNVDEFAEFEGDEPLKSGLHVLLERYNARVDAVELDKSLLIEIPENLD